MNSCDAEAHNLSRFVLFLNRIRIVYEEREEIGKDKRKELAREKM